MTDQDEIQSDFLFARPSFLEGVARLVDFTGSLNTYNREATSSRADARALANDARAVAHDVSIAFNELRGEVDERP